MLSDNFSQKGKKIDFSNYALGRIPYAESWQNKDEVLFDGSALNMTTWEMHYLLAYTYTKFQKGEYGSGANDWEAYYNQLATYKMGSVYFRGGIVAADYTEDYQINGNYFEIDGTQLPYMSVNSVSNLSSVDGYLVPNCMSSMFMYSISISTPETTKMKDIYELAFSENYIRTNATLSFNNIIITGNTGATHQTSEDENTSMSSSAIALMNRNAGGYSAITSNNGGNLNVTNSVIRGATLGVAIRYEGQLHLDYTYLVSNWANSIYLHDPGDSYITNSYIKDSGGSAIYVEDTESYMNSEGKYVEGETTTNNKVYLDTNTIIENYIVGTEGYFNANAMAGQVVALKGALEPELNKMNYKSIITQYNYLGLPSDMLNFVYMACVSGKHGDDVKDDNEQICWIPIVMLDGNGDPVYNALLAPYGMYVPVQHSAGSNRYDDANFKASVALIDSTNSHDVQNFAYFFLSYNIPTKGQSVLGLGIEQM